MADEDEIVNEAENTASDDNESSETENPKAAIAPKKKMLFILIALAVLLLGGAGVYFSGILKAAPSEEVVSEETDTDEKKPEEKEIATNPDGTPIVTEPPKDIYFDVPDILVNLNTDGKKQVYLKVLITLALPDAETTTKVENNMPRILDGFQIYLRELTVDEIQGSAGMFRLKEELVERINRIIAPSRINDVLFKEMLIQ